MRTLKFRSTALASALALTGLLSACGGGGGGSAPASSTSTSSSSTASVPSTTIPAGTTQSTPTYAAGSVQLAMFNQINAYRQQCGFPAVQQNTLLDQATQNHAQYMVLNGGQTTDTEVQGNPGFTGVTYQDRADALGWPAGVWASGGSGKFGNSSGFSNSIIGTEEITSGFGTGVYHQALVDWPYAYLGAGSASGTTNGVTNTFVALSIAGEVTLQNTPLTFPCQGVTGINPGNSVSHEIPQPPGTQNGFGTPINVVGNFSDQVTVTSASMTDSQGNAVALQILNASNDPNKALGPYEASVYPTAPLQANTTYNVAINGTINGTPFSRNFSFTTGAVQ